MNSFISHFKPWLAAGLALCAIECVYYVEAHPNEFDRTNFLLYAYPDEESFQRAITFDKIKAFADSKPVIVQSGDSSGLYDVDPRIVMKALPESHTYLNMSCCANLGFRGYYNIFKMMLERNPGIRYLILYVTPWALPNKANWESDDVALFANKSQRVFGWDVDHEFLSGWRIFQIPTLAARKTILNQIFYGGRRYRTAAELVANGDPRQEFLSLYKATNGWMPETDAPVAIRQNECFHDLPDYFDLHTFSRKSYLYTALESFADLARVNQATLIVIFNPVSCTASGPISSLERDQILSAGKRLGLNYEFGGQRTQQIIDDFKGHNPDVEIPFPVIETWSPEKFSANSHVSREYYSETSERVGRALAEIVARRERRDSQRR